ncbi:hypothetical protein V866_000061 [Kwoniella sp. B9012]
MSNRLKIGRVINPVLRSQCFCFATKEQIKNLFLQFYRPSGHSSLHTTQSSSGSSTPDDQSPINEKVNGTPPKSTYLVTSEKDTENHLDTLAEEFSQAIPDGKVSVSALQGYLMRFKREPTKAVEGVADWLENGCWKGPTMTLTKKGVEMRELDGGKDGLDMVKDREVKKAKKGKKDKKDKKDKEDKKDKKDKKNTQGNQEKGMAQDTKNGEAKGGDSDRSESLKEENGKGKDGDEEGNGSNDEKVE